VGETLRRLPWTGCSVDEDCVKAPVALSQFCTLEALEPEPLAGALIVAAEFGKAISPGSTRFAGGIIRRSATESRAPDPVSVASAVGGSRGSAQACPSRGDGVPMPRISGVMDLDGGVALRISSPGLERIRDDLAEEFHGLLTAQDLGRWTPHVTIQNKVEPREARRLLAELRSTFEPRPLTIRGLS
jgi:hypothetical protein